MSFPIESLVTDLREIGLVVGALVGFGFGFVLERAGFGRAPKLAAQFYLVDMTVFKVMFGAIVTAMLGVLVFSGLGLVDLRALSEGAVSATFVWPMLVGGGMLGMGFIVSGYCPGTSLVASGSGNIDGIVALFGIFVGSLLYGETFPLVEAFHTSGAQGQVFLYELLPFPPVVIGIAVTAMAVGGFIGAEKVEKIMTARMKKLAEVVVDESRDLPAPRRFVFGVYGVVAVAALVTLFFPVQSDAEVKEAKAVPIGVADLAQRLVDQPWTVRVIDIREQKKCAEERVMAAECVPAADLDELGLEYSTGSRMLVLVSDSGTEVPDAALGYPGELRLLEGGHAAWHEFALTEPKAPEAGTNGAALEAYRFRAALHGALTGSAAPAPAPAGPIEAFVPKKKKKGGGCN
jgi:hypothetical protein